MAMYLALFSHNTIINVNSTSCICVCTNDSLYGEANICTFMHACVVTDKYPRVMDWYDLLKNVDFH